MATEDRQHFSVKIELPSGSSLAANETFTEAIASKLRACQGQGDPGHHRRTSQSEDQPLGDPGQPGQAPPAQVHPGPGGRVNVRKQFPTWTDRKDVQLRGFRKRGPVFQKKKLRCWRAAFFRALFVSVSGAPIELHRI